MLQLLLLPLHHTLQLTDIAQLVIQHAFLRFQCARQLIPLLRKLLNQVFFRQIRLFILGR
jgi:hypothetical protein